MIENKFVSLFEEDYHTEKCELIYRISTEEVVEKRKWVFDKYSYYELSIRLYYIIFDCL
jgi:hypothetical protein